MSTCRSLGKMRPPCPHIVLIGPMGAGKTSVGVALARLLDRPFFDSDGEIADSTNQTAREIAADQGVESLHAMELRVFVGMAESKTPAVIAPAASVADSEEAQALLARCVTVWLTAAPEVLAARIGSGGHRRPVSISDIEALRDRREPYLRKAAALTVDTSDMSVTEVALRIATSLQTG